MKDGAEGSAIAHLRMPVLLLGITVALLMLLFLDLQPGNPLVTRTAAVAVLMALWWITGVIPLAATALLPLVLFPLLGILSAGNTAAQYINDTIFLFLGGFFVALAMQRWNLHRRIALRLLLLFGVQPGRLLLGFLFATFFLSMWISNTATTMMMLPIAMSVLDSLHQEDAQRPLQRYSIGLLLGIAFAASIGGTATLIGTPPNLSLARIFEITFPAAPPITFAGWFFFGFPLALSLLAVLWLSTYLLFVGRGNRIRLEAAVIEEQYRRLGTITYEQRAVFTVFLSLALLWMTRVDISFGDWRLPGWGNLFGEPDTLGDGTVAMAMGLLLFLLPSRSQPGEQLMDWETAKQVPWDIILLFGGGFALAKGIASSGLAAWIGSSLEGLGGLHPVLLVFLITLAVSFLTELTSNTATAEMLLPVMASLAVALNLHPLLLMAPTALACSFAFMLPVATPPNAIVFGTHRIRVIDMVRGGVLLNFAAVLLATLAIFTFGRTVLQMGDLSSPTWAKETVTQELLVK